VLNMRLAPYRGGQPGDDANKTAPPAWLSLISKANAAGVELKSTAWVAHEDPAPFTYNSYGVACTEAQVDVLTGETHVLQTDILFDCGISLNPAVDIGQVEGAFMQGLGYYMTEYIEYDQSGKLLTNGTWEYKPPSQKDIPIRLNVALLKDAPNPLGVLRSKASGEPPYCFASSVLLSVQHAVMSARKDSGLSTDFMLPAPATPWTTQQATGVSIEHLKFW